MLRKLAFVLVALTASSIVVSAQAAPTQVTLTPSAYKVLFGHKMTLSGRVIGGPTGQPVSITAWSYGKSAPTRVALVHTGAGGRFSALVKPSIQTKYEAHAAGLTSAPVTVGVAPSVSIRELSNGRIWTQVKAGDSLNRRIVKLQTLLPAGWHTVDQKRLSTASITVFSTRVPTSSVRIVMSVNQAGAGYLKAASHAMRYKAYALTIDAPSTQVLFGKQLKLSGQLMYGSAGQVITLQARPYGSSAPRNIATVKTDASGRWSFAVSPTIQTTYRARWGTAQTSSDLIVGVKPLVSVRELGNGDIWAHVGAGRPFLGKVVKLQQRTTGGAWRTVAQRPLNAKSETVFSVTAPDSSMRVAMSVNQAGKGLLGAMSHPFVYRTV